MPKIFLLILWAALPLFSMDAQLQERADRTWGPAAAGQLRSYLDRCAAQGLPLMPLENKVREGLAKGQPAAKVMAALEMRRRKLSAAAARAPQGPVDLGRLLFAAEQADSVAPSARNFPGESLHQGKIHIEPPAPAGGLEEAADPKVKVPGAPPGLEDREAQIEERMDLREEKMQRKMEAREKAMERRERARGRE